MEVNLKHKENFFESSNARGATIKLGAGLTDGPSPMEAVLMAAGGCSGVDVVGILEKMRQSYDEMEIKVTGSRRDDHPRYFDKIHIQYTFVGNLEEEKVRRAIELSLTKYCSVTNGLEPKAEVTYDLIIKSRGE